MPDERQPRPPTLLDALAPVIVMIALIALTIATFGVGATDGPLQVALMVSAAFASLVALKKGYSWAALADAAIGDVLVAVTAGDQYVADVLPSRMFRGEFRRRGIAPQVLSRAVEDSGTVTSPLVPWNTCGACMSGVLGVQTASYLPFCFFNLLSPVLDVLYGFIGFKVKQVQPPVVTAAPEPVEAQSA